MPADTPDTDLTTRARAVLADGLDDAHLRAALLEAAHGLWGMRREIPPALWRCVCGCGGLCDSGMPCPMGERFELTDLGHECARLLAERPLDDVCCVCGRVGDGPLCNLCDREECEGLEPEGSATDGH